METLADRKAKNAAVLACMDLYVVEVFFKGEWVRTGVPGVDPEDGRRMGAEEAAILAATYISAGDRARVVVA